MLGGNYALALRKTFFAEFVSMNMVMVGMIPTMVILMHALPASRDPMLPLFWGVMSAATLVGGITAYPINSWMVKRHVKHGMMSAMPPMKDMGDMKMETHAAPSLSTGTQLAVIGGTLAILAIVVAFTTRF